LEDVGEGEITIVVQVDVHNTLSICGQVMVCTGGGDGRVQGEGRGVCRGRGWVCTGGGEGCVQGEGMGVKHVAYSTTLHNSVYLLMDTLNNSA